VIFACLLTGAVVALVSGHTRLGMVLALVVGIMIGDGTASRALVEFLQLWR
jgi:hypothetical protein